METSYVSIYRTGLSDCTNNGVSSRHNSMLLFSDCTKEEAISFCEEKKIDVDKCLYLNKRILWGEDHAFAEPLITPEEKLGPMMGGNFCYTCDSRGYRYGGIYHLPIPIHDRFETQEEYDRLSR